MAWSLDVWAAVAVTVLWGTGCGRDGANEPTGTRVSEPPTSSTTTEPGAAHTAPSEPDATSPDSSISTDASGSEPVHSDPAPEDSSVSPESDDSSAPPAMASTQDDTEPAPAASDASSEDDTTDESEQPQQAPTASDAANDDAGPSTPTPSDITLEPRGWYAGSEVAEMPCLTAELAAQNDWGIYLASRRYLLDHGWTEEYFTAHFCPIDLEYAFQPIGLDEPYGDATVTYKATFPPYEQYWQHAFPVIIDDSQEPVLTDGAATIDETDTSPGHYPPDLLPMMQSVMSPAEVISALEVVAGPLTSGAKVNMGPPIGINAVRLYAAASQSNPDSVGCNDTYITFIVDVETGEALEPKSNGACP